MNAPSLRTRKARLLAALGRGGFDERTNAAIHRRLCQINRQLRALRKVKP